MTLGILFGLGAAFIWSTTSLMVKANAGRVDTLSFNAFRVLVGALFFWILVPFFGGTALLAQLSAPTGLVILGSVLCGFCLGDSIYFWSMTKIGVSRSMPIAGVYPVFTWLLAVPILGEQVTPLDILGTGLVLVALVLLAREHPQDAAEASDLLITPPDGTIPSGVPKKTRYLAVGAAIFAAFMWALSTTFLRLGIQFQEPVTMYDNVQQSVLISVLRLSLGAMVLLPVTQLLKGSKVWAPYQTRELPRLIALGVYSSGLGGLFFVASVGLIGAARAALVNSAAPLIGVVLSWLVLHERMTRRVWVGTALALVGVWLVLT